VTLSSRFTGISAFFLGVAIFYAPLAYGCARPEMLPTLYLLLGLSIAAGLAGFICRGQWPAVPNPVLFCFAAVMIQGWWMTANPVLPAMISDNGGFADSSTDTVRQFSFNSMLMTTLLLGAFVVLCDTLADPGWRRFLLLCVAASGVLISLIGIVLKLVGEPLMRYIWKPVDIYWNDFALFRYHGNAGAFLNLAWPLILVFTRRAWGTNAFIGKRILWTIASLACGCGLFLNASKAALAIGLLILPWPFSSGLKRLRHRTLFLLGVLSVLGLALILFASSQLAREAAFQRMTDTAQVSESVNGRWVSYAQYLQAIPAVGWFGIGPGLFQVAFPYQESVFRNVGLGIREYAHEDFLQTTIEWGWLGTVWWTLLVFGGLYRALRTYARRDRFPSRTDRHLVLACVLGVLGALTHALFDFPLQIASIRLFFLVLLALCWASPRLLTPPPRDPKRIRYHIPVPPKDYYKKGKVTSSSPQR
jgi:O-antigen ligase